MGEAGSGGAKVTGSQKLPSSRALPVGTGGGIHPSLSGWGEGPLGVALCPPPPRGVPLLCGILGGRDGAGSLLRVRTRRLSLSCTVLNPSEHSAAPNPSKNPLNALHHPAKPLHTPLSLPPPPPGPHEPPQRAQRCKITLPAPGARRRMTPDFSSKLLRAALEHLEPLRRAAECLCVLGNASQRSPSSRNHP